MIALVEITGWHILLVVFAAGGAWYNLRRVGKILEEHAAVDKKLTDDVSGIKQDVAVIKTEISHILEKIREISQKN